MPKIGHFDLLAPLYDRLISPHKGERLIQAMGLPIQGFLLDVGGGTGRVAHSLLGLADHLVVSDPSSSMLRQARSKPGLMPVASEAEALPFPDACFERIVMVDAFHHVRDQYAVLQEMWRVLANGGRLAIEEPDITRFAVRLVYLAERMALMRSRFVRAEDLAVDLSRIGADCQIIREGHSAVVVAEKPLSGTHDQV